MTCIPRCRPFDTARLWRQTKNTRPRVFFLSRAGESLSFITARPSL